MNKRMGKCVKTIFFQAILRIWQSEIEDAMLATLQFLRQIMPVSIMFLECYDESLNATRTIAKITSTGGMKIALLTTLSAEAKKWAERF